MKAGKTEVKARRIEENRCSSMPERKGVRKGEKEWGVIEGKKGMNEGRKEGVRKDRKGGGRQVCV